MDITWLGHSCFRIKGKEATVVTDPCPPSTGYNIGKITADIVTVSHGDENYRYLKAISGKPTVVDSAGEYEIHEAFITAIATYQDTEKGARLGKNISYIIEMEGLRVCHLGNLGHTPTAEQAEEMTGVDVLLIPVGGGGTIDGAKAAEIVSLLEARIVIPMHYQTDVYKDGLEPPDRFFKELGASPGEPQSKLAVTYTTVPSEMKTVLLDYKR